MSEYSYPYKDAEFIIKELIQFDAFCEQAGMDEINSELLEAVLEEANRLAIDVVLPLHESGDQEGVKVTENGAQEASGFAQAYQQYIENGWSSLPFDEEYGGQGMPKLLEIATSEIWQSADLSFSLCPLLTHGAVEALHKHGSDELKQTYLSKMISGEWTGTMNLTEPQAGSDLAAITTRAVPEGDHYRISGQKIYITWGDHQMTDNIIHLVLARLPNAPHGVKGISLFLVPKRLLDENGKPGEMNDVKCVSVEHKLGIHASPTCVMSFGEEGGAIGFLVGEPNRGLSAMFTMMNDARQSVGLQGLSVSSRSYQQALAWSKERLQGTRSDGSRYPIIEFPDVRRMLMIMKAGTEAMRALVYESSADIDRSLRLPDAEERARYGRRVDLYTPIVKGWLSELAQELTSHGIQLHGGMGYVEETGSARLYRDARITTIYEGTTAIQANDLVGRKTLADGGETLTALVQDIQKTASELVETDELGAMGEALQKATNGARDSLRYLLENAKKDRSVGGAAGVNFLMQLGYVCGGWMMGRSALCATEMLANGEGERSFLEAKLITAQFYMDHLLPRAGACLQAVRSGHESIMALNEDQF